MIRALGLALGATAFGLLVFLVGLGVNFPSDDAVARAQWELQQASDGRWSVEAASASLWWLSGMAFDEVVLYKVEQDRHRRTIRSSRRRSSEPEAEPEPPKAVKAVPFLKIDELKARLQLLPLARGRNVVAYAAELAGGSLSGTMSQSETRRTLTIEGDAIDMSRLPLEGEDFSLDAAGLLFLDGDLDISLDDPEASSGEASLRIDDLALSSASVYGFDLGAARFTEAILELAVEKGEIVIKKGRFASDVVTADISGSTTIGKRDMGRWRLRVEIRAQFNEQFDGMLKMLPKIKHARDEEGAYHFVCSGSLGRPYCREDRVSPMSGVRIDPRERFNPRRGPRDRIAEDGPERDEPVGADEDPDERRKRRLERIRDRRDRARAMRDGRDDLDARGSPEDLEEFDEQRDRDRLPPGEFEEEPFYDEMPPEDERFIEDERRQRFDPEFDYRQDEPME